MTAAAAVPPAEPATIREWLPRVLRFCFPHPARFHQVWGIQTGAAPLFVWEPVPPSAEYVALGMVASQSEEPPPSSAAASSSTAPSKGRRTGSV